MSVYWLYRGVFPSCENDYGSCCTKHCGRENLHLAQMDMKTTFLHGELGEIDMHQPEGYANPDVENLCAGWKRVYGLKKAPRQWYKKFDSFMERCQTDHLFYIKRYKSSYIILLYVDDIWSQGQIWSRLMISNENFKVNLRWRISVLQNYADCLRQTEAGTEIVTGVHWQGTQNVQYGGCKAN